MSDPQHPDIHADRILILDFGSQYTQLIARRVREAHVYSEIRAFDMDADALRPSLPKASFFPAVPNRFSKPATCVFPRRSSSSGFPCSASATACTPWPRSWAARGEGSDHREFGYAQVRARGHSRLLKDIEDHRSEEGFGLLDVWMSHGDSVTAMPEGFKLIASTDNAPLAGMADETRQFYGIQFHPEVTHTRQGAAILSRFVHDICACRELWTAEQIIDDSIERVRARVGGTRCCWLCLGGVDSSVVAALLHRAIGDQLTCIFVDNGLLRLNEGDQVMATFAEHLGVKVIRVDAQARFLEALAGSTIRSASARSSAICLSKFSMSRQRR